MFSLVQNGEVLEPKPLGIHDVLCACGIVAKIGSTCPAQLYALDEAAEILDATDCYVTPGIIDPHEHLIGGSGEKGFATQTPEIALHELVEAGITTVVGCLGVDTTTKTMPSLLAKVKGLNESGITAFLYCGGYDVPPVTLTGSVRRDMLFVSEVIGAGETAISDARGMQPTLRDLAKLVSEAYVGGILTGKAGITHFHVGEGGERLEPLRSLLSRYPIEPSCLYPTHVQRNEPLMREAIELTRRGVTIDLDTVDEDLPKWAGFFLKHDGVIANLTVSSDAGIPAPRTLFEQIRAATLELKLHLSDAISWVTANPARVLKLRGKGRLRLGADADLLVIEKGSLRLRHVVARGLTLLKDGHLVIEDPGLAESSGRIARHGEKTNASEI